MSDGQLYFTAGTTAVVCAVLAVVWFRTRKSRQRVAVLSMVVAFISLIATIVQVSLAVAPAGKPMVQSSAVAGCETTVMAGHARSDPERVGNLAFCPTRINDGVLPISGPFNLTGQVVGPIAQRRNLVLFVRLDPTTCTTQGKPAAPGRFLIDSVDFALDSDGSWSYRDNLGGHPPAVTLGRTFEFASASEDAVQDLLERRDEWRQSGITRLPEDIQVLSHFNVPPGRAASKAPCG